jgi:hypothetical protein
MDTRFVRLAGYPRVAAEIAVHADVVVGTGSKPTRMPEYDRFSAYSRPIYARTERESRRPYA